MAPSCPRGNAVEWQLKGSLLAGQLEMYLSATCHPMGRLVSHLPQSPIIVAMAAVEGFLAKLTAKSEAPPVEFLGLFIDLKLKH